MDLVTFSVPLSEFPLSVLIVLVILLQILKIGHN